MQLFVANYNSLVITGWNTLTGLSDATRVLRAHSAHSSRQLVWLCEAISRISWKPLIF